MCLHLKFHSKVILSVMISFFHYTILARLDAFVNAVEIPSQNNTITKKKSLEVRKKIFGSDTVKNSVTVREWVMYQVYASNRHLESTTVR